MSAFDQTWLKLGNALPNTLSNAASSQLQNKLMNRFAPHVVKPLQKALRGDMGGALSAMQAGLLGFAQSRLAEGFGKMPLLGGMSLREAKQLQREAAQTRYARKNIFSIVLEDPNPPPNCDDVAYLFGFFATDVAFGPNTITSEPKQTGTAVMDSVSGTERTELRITTYDDTQGSIKRWFDGKCAQIAHSDGTVGLPVEYLIKLSIMQGAVDDLSAALCGAMLAEYVVRPASCELEYARSEDQLQQVQLTFAQFDTFAQILPTS